MTPAEFQEWKVYFNIEPFGARRADIHAGLIASVIANVNRDSKTKPEPFSIEDFMLFERQYVPEETEEQAAMRLLAQSAALRARAKQ